jgi:hypothetical protein
MARKIISITMITFGSLLSLASIGLWRLMSGGVADENAGGVILMAIFCFIIGFFLVISGLFILLKKESAPWDAKKKRNIISIFVFVLIILALPWIFKFLVV